MEKRSETTMIVLEIIVGLILGIAGMSLAASLSWLGVLITAVIAAIVYQKASKTTAIVVAVSIIGQIIMLTA